MSDVLVKFNKYTEGSEEKGKYGHGTGNDSHSKKKSISAIILVTALKLIQYKELT